MPTLYAEIDINAPQSVVWEALIRKDQWRFWNTFFYDCDPGLTIARGNEIFLAMQRLEGDEETELQPVITMMRAPYVMKWVSTIPGLRSEHVFELRETMPGRTHYIHRETFSGVLSKVFLPFIRQDERQGLRRMAQQLKMHVENTILGTTPPSQRRDPRAFYPQQGYSQQGYSQQGYSQQGYSQPSNQPYPERPYNDSYGSSAYGEGPDSERPYSRGTHNNRFYGDRPYDDRPPQNAPYGDHYSQNQPASQRPPYPPQSQQARAPQNEPQPDQYSSGPHSSRQDPYNVGQYNRDQYNGGHYSAEQYDNGRQYTPENKPHDGRQNDYPTYKGYSQNDTPRHSDRRNSNHPF
ncbi:MAG: hypothetical protein AAFP03_02445 [Cyanobacteria bacterium J06598_3]